MGSHECLGVIELFGRNRGETALVSGYLAYADRVCISEMPFNIERLAEFLKADRQASPSNQVMVVMSEGARMEGGEIVQRGKADAYGHQKLGGIGQIAGDLIREITGVGIIHQNVAYLMRCGAPDALDLTVATNNGTLAGDLLMAKQSGRTVALKDGRYTHIPQSETRAGARKVDVDALYAVEYYRPRMKSDEGMPRFLC